MIDLLAARGGSWTEYFGPAVLQNTLFLGLIFLALYILRNTRASARYALCVIGMVKLLLPPGRRSRSSISSILRWRPFG